MTQRTITEIVEHVLKMTVDNQMAYDTYTPVQKDCFHANIRKAVVEAVEVERRQAAERLREVVEAIEKEAINELTWYMRNEGVDEFENNVNYIKLSDLYDIISNLKTKHNIDITPNTPQV